LIFVSAGQDPEAIAAARAAGGVYCLSKPIDDLVLLDLVEQALWMPHLVRRHLDVHGHGKHLKAPRVLTREAHRSTVHF
jgi:FixJ family two-component response regulator